MQKVVLVYAYIYRVCIYRWRREKENIPSNSNSHGKLNGCLESFPIYLGDTFDSQPDRNEEESRMESAVGFGDIEKAVFVYVAAIGGDIDPETGRRVDVGEFLDAASGG